MIAIIEIVTAVNAVLKAAVQGTKYVATKVETKDAKKGFSRPSFFTETDNASRGNQNALRSERNLTIRVYYFPTDINKHRIELIEIQDLLERAFMQPLRIKEGFLVGIDETEVEVTDGTLQLSFDIQIFEDIDESITGDDQYETMETLEYE